MKQWEYKFVVFKREDVEHDAFINALNKEGKKGWDIAEIVDWNNRWVLFKREI